MKQLFDWNAFRDTVNETMGRVRMYLNFSNKLTKSPFMDNMTDSTIQDYMFQNDINSIVNPEHDRLLAVCYKRMNGPVISILNSLCKKVPMIKFVEPDSDSDSDTDDDDEVVVDDFRSYISDPQYNILKNIVLRLAVFKTDVLFKCVSFFPFFGIHEGMLTNIRQIIHDFQEGSLTEDQQVRMLKELRGMDRHAYNLLHLSSELVREVQNFAYLRVLPYHYWQYQIEAIQERYGGVAGSNKILESALFFRFCKVCDKVYSLMRDFHSVYKNNYKYGFRDAVVDYSTMEVYCKRKKHNHRGSCDAQPLAKIPLLGHLLLFNGKCIILCPQKRCGMPMVLDPMLSLYNERGPACIDCTAVLCANTNTMIEIPSHEMRCVKCMGPLPRPQNTFLYPHGVVLCRKHNLKGMSKFIRKKNPQNSEDTHALIVKYTIDKKEERHISRLPILKRQLAHMKQSARANIRR
jgi:hypothetical protein